MKAFLLLFFLAIASAEAAPQRRGVVPRTVMVQLFEWPWAAVAEECEKVLGPAGFAAVQISPPTEHVLVPGNPWWERYQPVSHRIESRSGSEAELGEMVSRCREAGVDVYADVVLNHMAGRHAGEGFAGSTFTHYDYPGLFSFDDFHHCGRNGNDDIMDFTDLYELRNCELVNLADLDTSAPDVQGRLAGLLQRLLGLGVAGFRVDAAKHMAPADIAGIFARVKGAFYVLHELIIGPGEPVEVEPYLPLGDVNVFPYAYIVGDAFLRKDLRGLPGIGGNLGVASSHAVVLLENHDLERRPKGETVLPFVKAPELNRLATVFMLTFPYGYPQLYSSFHFDNYDAGPPLKVDGTVSPPGSACGRPWTCSHRDPATLALVDFRNRTDKEFRVTDLAIPEKHILAFGRGSLGHVVINAGEKAEEVNVPTSLKPGRYRSILGGEVGEVSKEGNLHAWLPPRSAFVVLQ